MEVEVGRRHVPNVDFHEFQEIKAPNEGPQAKSHIQRRHDELGMVVARHLGGRLGMDCGRRWLGGCFAIWHSSEMGDISGFLSQSLPRFHHRFQ